MIHIKILRSFRDFFATQAAGGVVLIFATAVALLAANSGYSHAYHDLFETPIGFSIGGFSLSKSLHFWINDGLMAIFFFLVGLEIKREILIGELATMKKAALPIVAAIGGMAVPAVIYMAFNIGSEYARGWAIPTATDIAFALGIISLLGRRVPIALTVFLTALAIVDDMGAVVIIAIFYTEQIIILPLVIAIGALLAAGLLNIFNVRHPSWYGIAGVVAWYGLFHAGIHPTIAGVLIGLLIPVRGIYDNETWLSSVENILKVYRKLLVGKKLHPQQDISKRQDAVQLIEEITEKAQSPLARLEHGFQPWVAFGIMPLFALANAGVTISPQAVSDALVSTVSIGVFFGLVVGKQIGIFAASWLAVKVGLADLPRHAGWTQVYGASLLAGIGFTMSLFITELSFARGTEVVDLSKMGILGGSLVAGVGGYICLALANRGRKLYNDNDED